MKVSNFTTYIASILIVGAAAIPTFIDTSAEDFSRSNGKIEIRSSDSSNGTGPHTDYCVTNCKYHATKVGNGNPHQNFVITQKGGTLIACPGSTTQSYSHTLGWSISGGVNSPYTSAGFSVSESETYGTSQTFSCHGDTVDICILFYQAVTSYTVHVTETCQTCGTIKTYDHGNHVIHAPNANQVGSVAARGINVPSHGVKQCDGNADRSVNFFCGPPGGPEYWNGKAQGPFNGDYLANRQPSGCNIPIEAYHYND